MNGNFEEIEIKRNQFVVAKLLNEFIQYDGFICGGFARFCCSEKEKPQSAHDIDIYCLTENSFNQIKLRLENNGYISDKNSDVAISYKYSFDGQLPVQLIKPLKTGHLQTVGVIEEILSNFDFTIARCGLFLKDGEIKAICDIDFIHDDNENRLNIKNIHCPIAEIYRVSKYAKKGYFLPAMQAVKILVDWENRDDEYKEKIQETLHKENPTQEEIEELEKLLHID